MSGPHPSPPNRPLRRQTPKRFFKELIMPVVDHPAGAVPEALQPKSDAKSARFAVMCCTTAVIVFGAWIGFLQIRKVIRSRSVQAADCCGCDQGRQGLPCAKGSACPSSGTSRTGCRPKHGPFQGKPDPAVTPTGGIPPVGRP
jgi:hypothetical protein